MIARFAQGKVRARIASQSVTAAASTLDAHLEKLRELRDKADRRGQTNAAIRSEELRGQLNRFYVKQIETVDAGEFERMSTEEERAYVYGEQKPPKGETKH
jgi:peptidyl-tRNA hydrolase